MCFLMETSLQCIRNSQAPNPNNGGLRQVHLFRFSDDKIVEYWDITQQVLENAPNAAGAFS